MKTKPRKRRKAPLSGPIITTDEAARYLDLPAGTVRTYLSRGILRGKKVGRTVLIFASAVESYGKSRKKPGRPKKSATTCR